MSCIINMDETPVFLDLPDNYTVDQLGNNEIKGRTTGHEKERVTVVLTAAADGTKFKPFVIFARKTVPKKLPKGVVAAVQDKGWMDEAKMLEYQNKVWAPGPANFGERLLGVFDSHKPHLTDKVLESCLLH